MKRFITDDELILNPDGSVYHLNLKPAYIADTIITVGDPDRVKEVTKFFDRIEVTIQKREFLTQTGTLKGKKLTVISTGIGTDNIDIILNELDALVNIDLPNRTLKHSGKTLSIIRIGTSGTLKKDVPVNSLLISEYAVGLDGMLHFYQDPERLLDHDLSNAIDEQMCPPINSYAAKANEDFLSSAPSDFLRGITITNTGFYGPQARNIRMKSNIDFSKLDLFEYQGLPITNLEMETAGIYGLAALMGHRAISFNAILANRSTHEFSNSPQETVDLLIQKVLAWITTCV